ncbi:hypothetical protein BJX99DRAFT_235493 [Aspergillus californicus]
MVPRLDETRTSVSTSAHLRRVSVLFVGRFSGTGRIMHKWREILVGILSIDINTSSLGIIHLALICNTDVFCSISIRDTYSVHTTVFVFRIPIFAAQPAAAAPS